MKIKIIAAIDQKGGIGVNGQLPWPHFSEDMKRFKQLTMGSAVIMGRKTFDSLPGPLTGRKNIVITSNWFNKNIQEITNCTERFCNHNHAIFHSNIDRAFDDQKILDEDVWIIGGAQIYQQTINIADELYLTRIKKDYAADTLFPKIDYKDWVENGFDQRYSKELGAEYSFEVWKRRK